jgi:4-coumarate--CoA ligase
VHTVFSGAAPLDADLQKALEKRMPHTSVRQGYGMTESSPITNVAGAGPSNKLGSVGPPLPNTDCRVLDVSTGAELPSGSSNVGELQVRGPQVMMGYHKNEKATAETLLPGGWLRTGDLVYYDADGSFFIVDRLKELIKSKGFQVAPAELEGLLMAHPLIYDCAVVGKADERSGEVPVAFVVTKASMLAAAGNAAGAAALPPLQAPAVQDFVAAKVAEYKRLAEVHFVEAIPKSAAGKILRRVLRDKLKEEAAALKAKQA